MLIQQLSIDGLRTLQNVSLDPDPGINSIVGENGAGKSSVLEAIHLIATGRSYRSRKVQSLLPPDQEAVTVRMALHDPAASRLHHIGLQKLRAGGTRLKLDHLSLSSIVEVTRMLPVKIISPDSHALVQEGPDERRQFLDWGLFHVEPEFLSLWQAYRRILQQRNQALKFPGRDNALSAWDQQLSEVGEKLSQHRHDYVDSLCSVLAEVKTRLPELDALDIRYRQGWSKEKSLLDALKDEQQQSMAPAFTTAGPHRADMVLTYHGRVAREHLSRGEQKLLVYALHLAQLEHAIGSGMRKPIVLLDDLAAELDSDFLQRVLSVLQRLKTQSFITGNMALPESAASVGRTFHMQGGLVAKVV